MAGKSSPTLTISPFKFGFFAGLGFFCASALMTMIGFLGIVFLGGAMTGALMRDHMGSSASNTNSVSQASPAVRHVEVANRN